MKIGIAGFHLESVSYLSHMSTQADFEKNTSRADKIIEDYENTNTVPGGFIRACDQFRYQIVPLIYSFLGALGPADSKAVEVFADEVVELAEKSSLDGLLLHLHGATWAPDYSDPEKYILNRLRSCVGKDIPIIVAFDYHGNIDQDTIASADAAFAYHRSPHTDMADTGKRAATCLRMILENGFEPVMVVKKPGLIVPSIFSATSLKPLSDILDHARALEKQHMGYLDISIMAGFSYSDSHNIGFSVLVVSDRDEDHATEIASKLCMDIYDFRADLYRPDTVYEVGPAIDLATSLSGRNGKPIVLLEHADRMNDSTYLLSELIKRNVDRAIIPFLWDSEAALRAHQAGAGATIRLELGAWSSKKAGPREAHMCEVLQTGRKSYRISGEMLRGQKVDLGITALLKINGVTVSIVSNFVFAVDGDVFDVFGQSISDFDIIVLRSKTHFRQYFEEKAAQIIIVDTPDHGPADLTQIDYRHIDKDVVYPFSELS